MGFTRRSRWGVILVAVLGSVACAEPLEFADWTFPVDADTPVLEYAPDGAYAMSFGREGQGPGELQFPRAIARTGDHIVVSDTTRARLITWTTAGELHGEVPLEFARGLSSAIGQTDGSIVAAFDVRADDWPLVAGFGNVGPEGELVREYLQLPAQVPMYRHERGFQALLLPATRPRFAATAAGIVYVSRGDEYQVLSLTLDGRQRWALRVAAPRRPYDEDDIGEAIARLADRMPEISRDNIDLPPGLPAPRESGQELHPPLKQTHYFILLAIADGEQHGYAIRNRVEEPRLAP